MRRNGHAYAQMIVRDFPHAIQEEKKNNNLPKFREFCGETVWVTDE
jgi:hypothetical protein